MRWPLCLLLAACSSADPPATAPETDRPPAIESTSEPGAPSHESEPVAARSSCEAARAHAAEVLAPMDAAIAELAARAPDAQATWVEASSLLRTCYEGPRGAWVFAPSDAHAEAERGVTPWGDEEQDSYRFEVTATPTFIDADGARHPAPRPCIVRERPLQAERGRVEMYAHVDYDGDGADEVIVQCTSGAMESSDRTLALWSFRAGAVAAYPPAEGIDLAGATDADADGRPDLVSIERYWQATSCGDFPPPEGAPPVLFHALPDGTFSDHDEVAARHLRQACPEAPRRLLTEDDCNGFAARRSIACARLWGAGASSIRARLARDLEALSPDARSATEPMLDALLAFAAIDPPLSLAPAD